MSQAFSSNKCQDCRRYFKIFGGIAVVFCALLLDEKASAACSEPLFCIIALHVIVNALFTAVTCYQ